LPNGYGSISKLSGKRRRPWVVRLTESYSVTGGDVTLTRKVLGYFETRSKALDTLAEYNKKPYDIDAAGVTFAEIYELWIAGKKNVTESSYKRFGIMFDHSKPLHDRTFRSLRASDMQTILDSENLGYATQRKLISLWQQMYKYAVANDIADKNYAEYLHKTADQPESTRRPFTEEEIARLRELTGSEPYADVILILIYTGWRIGELFAMNCSNIDTAEWTMKGGSKTEAGKNRLVPVHDSIKPYIEKYLAQGGEKLIPRMNYSKFSGIFRDICTRLGTPHTIHDTRHTFATRADNFGMNKVCIQRLMGHASKDVTEKVYTHKDLEQLRKAIEKLP
ncbi:MAG: site-specific integrase, partial [Ruminococcus sp.]|nr:site-specific integrase [Ruminococcus sp.]